MVRTGSKGNPIANLSCNCHIALIIDVSGPFSAYFAGMTCQFQRGYQLHCGLSYANNYIA